MPEFDIFAVWWGRLGLAGVFGVFLYFLVKWVGKRMASSEMRLQNQIADRASEDKMDRIRASEEARKERDAIARRLRDIEDARVEELKNNTAVVVKALSDCAVSQQGNDRSRRRLDITLREMIFVLQNIPCNRVPSGDVRGTFKTPLPEETPDSGMETIDETTAPLIRRADVQRVRPKQ